MRVFEKSNLPSDPETWQLFRKTALTRATRIDGPFTVQTSEGPLKCQDGYLAVDARGYPYPIAADEFAMIYEKVQRNHDDPRERLSAQMAGAAWARDLEEEE